MNGKGGGVAGTSDLITTAVVTVPPLTYVRIEREREREGRGVE